MRQHYKKPFVGTQDNAKFVWSNKTHRTVSEAFRDADYATPIWRCETDFQAGMRFLGEALVGMVFVGVPIAGLIGFVVWLGLLKI
jgi:hypothetical protein